ncbi:extracellular solute-binding protein [Roseovarius aestuarii]|uniref:Bacterial extracellular solute-binding protein n=1 Tax=Roseovarius aestuarii TaxID=475083 RepID=A0A1X7BTP1_9RHOB|nr:extracellular solute-binding protein [Roseovarius aestuarii]SMC12978.1 Bacterial extracellular solute-binding protein [Roseovarius aestuarii]
MNGLSRRQALLGLSTSSFVMPLANPLFANTQQGLHNYAARTAARLTEGRDVQLGLLLPNGSGASVNPVIEAFKTATGISIRSIETPVDDINVQLTLDTLNGKGDYDLALPATFGLPDLVSSGAILPITQYANEHEPDGFRDDILYQTGDSFDGNIFGFQTDGDAYVMFYHKDLLNDEDEKSRFADTHGYSLNVPETWEQLDQQIQYFNRPDQGLGGGLLFRTPSYVTWEWWVRFHARGYWPFSRDLVPQIASDAGVTALEDLIRVSEHLCPETATLGLFENWERYARGDVYCNIGWGGSQKFLNGPESKMQNRMKFGPTPGGLVDGHLLFTPYFNWGWNYVVTSQSREPEIAYLFALFASSSEMSKRAVRQQAGFFDPFRLEHYEDLEIRKTYSDEFLEVHAASMRNAIPDLYLAHQGEYFRVLSEWLYRALTGEVKPEDALERVAENWALISVRTGHQKQKERWMQLRNKYPQAVRNRLRDYS